MDTPNLQTAQDFFKGASKQEAEEGCYCTFFKFNDKLGLKTYRNRAMAKDSQNCLRRGYELGLSPWASPDLMWITQFVWGFWVELAVCFPEWLAGPEFTNNEKGRFRSNRTNKEQRRWYDESDLITNLLKSSQEWKDLVQKVIRAGLPADDFHKWNFGVTRDNRIVIIDLV